MWMIQYIVNLQGNLNAKYGLRNIFSDAATNTVP